MGYVFPLAVASQMAWDTANVIYGEEGPNPPLSFTESSSRVTLTEQSELSASVTLRSLTALGPGDGKRYAEVHVTLHADLHGNLYFATAEGAYANFDLLPNMSGTAVDITVGVSGYGYQSGDTVSVDNGTAFVLQFLLDFENGLGQLGVNNSWFNWISFDPPGALDDDQAFEFTPEASTRIWAWISPDEPVEGSGPTFKLVGTEAEFEYALPDGAVAWES
jgi:hypothetical protein